MFSDPNSSDRDTSRQSDSDQSDAAVQAAVLQSGLAALKNKDYATAITHLESLSRADTSSANRFKAQMGLVRAYARTGEAAQAIALCRQLHQSSRPQVRTWATQTLNELTQTFPQPSQATEQTGGDTASKHNLSGFTPFEAPPTPSDPTAPINSPDPSGFVAWGESEELHQRSGIEPNQTSAAQKSADKYTVDSDKDLTSKTSSIPHHPDQSAAGGKLPASSILADTEPHQGLNSTQRTPPAAAPVSASNPTASAHLESISEANVDPLDSPPEQIQWRNAGRADRLRSLGRVKQWKLRLAIAGTAIALFWLVRFLIHSAMESINRLLVWIRWPINLQPIQLLYKDPTWPLIILLLALVLLSPWIFDLLLKFFYGLQPFSTRGLTQYSPEAVRILRRVCQQRGWFLPPLKLLPMQTPVCFTYGCLPRYARIVVSQGLLDQLTEDEIATLYAYELGHLGRRWDWLLMSGLGLLLQLPYLGYWQTAAWGDRQTHPILRNLAAGSSTVFYGTYWLIRKVGLLLSRLRTYYSDRTAVELTGNPNGLTRALLKTAIGYTNAIQQQGYTNPLIESIDLLTPLGNQTALHLGVAIPQAEKGIAWDLLNPYRHWLTLNNAHPLTGDRIHLLNLYARYWGLATELDLESSPPPRAKIRFQSWAEFSHHWRPLLRQGSPFFGLPVGWAIAMLFWGFGIFSTWMNWWRLDWLYQDPSILKGSLLLGLGIGVMLRINPFFPDLKPATWQTSPNLRKLLSNSQAIPIEGPGIKTQGKLLGRSGIANWLGQDLILQTRSGLIKLHFLSQFGPIGNLLTKQKRPAEFVGHTLQVIGWFRRGATSWIDVDQLQAPGNQVIRANHPIWSTLISLMLCLWGLYIIYKGGN